MRIMEQFEAGILEVMAADLAAFVLRILGRGSGLSRLKEKLSRPIVTTIVL